MFRTMMYLLPPHVKAANSHFIWFNTSKFTLNVAVSWNTASEVTDNISAQHFSIYAEN